MPFRLHFALWGEVFARPPLPFTPKQIAVGAAFFHDGATQAEIAGQMGLTRQAVGKILATLKRRAAECQLPPPRRFRAGQTRHVRQLDIAVLG